MIRRLLGIKLGQSQAFTESGRRIPVTKLMVGPCRVITINNGEAYRSIQLGFGTAKHLTKAVEGHLKKAGTTEKPRFLREIRVAEIPEGLRVGSQITVGDVFKPGDTVAVTGVSIGKGFAGVVRRHGFAGGPRTHGQSDRERAPGSIGQTTTPGRVYRGKRMAGRMGGRRATVTGLSVISVEPENNVLVIKGLVPGPINSLVMVQEQ